MFEADAGAAHNLVDRRIEALDHLLARVPGQGVDIGFGDDGSRIGLHRRRADPLEQNALTGKLQLGAIGNITNHQIRQGIRHAPATQHDEIIAWGEVIDRGQAVRLLVEQDLILATTCDDNVIAPTGRQHLIIR
ncbi:hypothetical protein D3C75_588050 [compost metagenome]